MLQSAYGVEHWKQIGNEEMLKYNNDEFLFTDHNWGRMLSII
jgi:hypothetical protein